MARRKKDRQSELAETAHRIWLAGLGAVAVAEEEGGRLFKSLVERGEGMEERGRDRVSKAKGAVSEMRGVASSYWETLERTVDQQMTAVLHRIGVPTKEEIEALTRKVESLTSSIERLRTRSAPRPRAPRAKAEPKAE